MTNQPFPKRTASQAIGEVGIGILGSIIREELGWDFRRTPQESDYGIDGYIDVIAEGGYVTGRGLAVQAKTGHSYLVNADDNHWLYRGEIKHINYYLNSPVAVLLILVNPDSREAWWRVFDPYETEKTDAGWTTTIAKASRFAAQSKASLLEMVGAPIDYLAHLEAHWMIGENVKEAALVCIEIGRSEILAADVRPFARLVERLSSSRETILSAMNKVDFLIGGYDDDPRDLFEIPEVVAWVKQAIAAVKYLAFFLCLGDAAQGIGTIVACLCGADRVDAETVKFRDIAPALVFTRDQFLWLNEFTTKHKLDDQTNEAVSMLFSAKMKSLRRLEPGVPG